jgi:hypothetical protein
MSVELHEIAEANHRILNPFTYDKLMLVGKVCHLKLEMRLLDVARAKCCASGRSTGGLAGSGWTSARYFWRRRASARWS